MEFVFEEGDLGIEQDWVLSGEFPHRDRMGLVLWISRLPRELRRGRGRMSAIRRRVCPVVRFRGRCLGNWDARVWPSPVASDQHPIPQIKCSTVMHRLFSQVSAYPTLTPPSPSSNGPFLTPSNARVALNTYFHPEGLCSNSRTLLPKVISGNGMSTDAWIASSSVALEMGRVHAQICQS